MALIPHTFPLHCYLSLSKEIDPGRKRTEMDF
jgi:hypothetical protein